MTRKANEIHYRDTRTSKYSIYSAAKAILSIGVGIARDQEKFDIDKSVLSYIPAYLVGAALTDTSGMELSVHLLRSMEKHLLDSNTGAGA